MIRRAHRASILGVLLAFGCTARLDLGRTPRESSARDTASNSDASASKDDLDVEVSIGAPRRMFVTSASYVLDVGKGNISSVDDVYRKPDAYCAEAAQAAGLGGTWRAWLYAFYGTQERSPAAHVGAHGPYVLVDGKTTVFSGASPGASAEVTPSMTEWGKVFPFTDYVWIGSPGLDCNNASEPGTPRSWATNNPTDVAAIAYPFDRSTWSAEAGQTSCVAKAHLYCFEQ